MITIGIYQHLFSSIAVVLHTELVTTFWSHPILNQYSALLLTNSAKDLVMN